MQALGSSGDWLAIPLAFGAFSALCLRLQPVRVGRAENKLPVAHRIVAVKF